MFFSKREGDHISLPIPTAQDPNHISVAALPTLSQPSPHPGVGAGVLSAKAPARIFFAFDVALALKENQRVIKTFFITS